MNRHAYLLALPLALGCLITPGTGRAQDQQSLEDRLDAQEERIRELEAAQFDFHDSGLDISASGFIDVAAHATNLGADGPSYLNADNEVRFADFSDAGLQVEARINDRVSGTVQLLSPGETGFETRAEWAYISHQLTDSTKVRAGRLVAPFYMHSQYYHVGYAYPWIEPPAEVYESAPLRSFEGIDLLHQFSTGNIAHTLNVYYGAKEFSEPVAGIDIEYKLHNMAGATISSSLGNLGTWLAYSISDSDYPLPDCSTGGCPALNPGPDLSPLSFDNDHGYFASAGFQYDNGRIMAMAEVIELALDQHWLPTTRAGYATLGYRLGEWMPHVTWARSEDTDFAGVKGDPPQEYLYNSAARHQKSWTFGVRGELAENLAVKAEVSRYYDIGNRENLEDSVSLSQTDTGFFDTSNDPAAARAALNDEDSPMVFRVALNLVF